MNVLIACEESGIVTEEFRKRGHNAYSCDLLPTSGNHPEWHIQGDVLKHLNDGWDMMIAFPPCTFLCVTGNKWFKPEYKERFPNRNNDRDSAINFFISLYNAPIEKIAIENPIGIMSTILRKPDQIIQPWQFGDPHLKKTCLWLKELPPLLYTQIVQPEYVIYKSKTKKEGQSKYPIAWAGKIKETKMPMLWKMGPNEDRQRLRSKTFPGIANAMAEQWG